MLLLLREEDDSLKRYQSEPLLNHRSPLLALTIVFIAISWICSLLRLYVRLVVQRAPGWDDFFIVLAMVCLFLNSTSKEENTWRLTPAPGRYRPR